MRMVSVIGTIDEDILITPIKERLGVEELVALIMSFDGNDIDEYDKIVSTLVGKCSYSYAPKKLDLELKK